MNQLHLNKVARRACRPLHMATAAFIAAAHPNTQAKDAIIQPSADHKIHELPAVWTAAGVGEVERIEPSNMQHLGIQDLVTVEVEDKGALSAELELTWESFPSANSSEQEIELELQYGITSWLSSKLTLPYIWAGPDSKDEHSGMDDIQLELKTLLFRFHKIDIGTETEIAFPTGSTKVGAGEEFSAENKLVFSIYPHEDLAFHASIGLNHEEKDFTESHLYSLAMQWAISEKYHIQCEYGFQGDDFSFDQEAEYHLLLNYLNSERLELQFVLRGEMEDDEHILEIGPGFKSEIPLGFGDMELQIDLGAFAGITQETEDYGARGLFSISF